MEGVMSKVRIFLAVLMVLIAAAFATNPNKEEYVSWAKDRIIEESEQNLLIGLGVSKWGHTVIEGTTRSSNYLVFLICRTKTLSAESVTLGAFRSFMPMGTNKVTSESEKRQQ